MLSVSLGSNAGKELTETFINCANIVNLNLSNSKVLSSHYMLNSKCPIYPAITSLRNLIELNISNTAITGSHLEKILETCTQLKKIWAEG